MADKSRKQIYAELKAKGHEAHKLHRTVHRPSGAYIVLEDGNGFKIKRIEVKPVPASACKYTITVANTGSW